MLQINNLSISFPSKKNCISVVSDLSFSLNQGENVAIVGESGSGKSVTALSILQLLDNAIIEGSIKFDGLELTTLDETSLQQIRGNNIAMIFQEPMNSLNPVFTIGKQIEESFLIHTSISNPKNAVLKLLKQVGFSDVETLYNKYPHELSGGMRQRVMIAIALSCNPSLLIADEPTTALDVTIQAQILNLIKNLNQENKRSLILITHDLSVVSHHVDRIIVMYHGRIVEDCSIKVLQQQNSIRHPYTKALIASSEKMLPIEGQIPCAVDRFDGCSFAQRCSYATPECHQQKPLLVGATHRWACFNPCGGDNAIRN